MPLLDSGGITALGTTPLNATLEPDDIGYHNSRTNNTTYSGVQLNSNGTQYRAAAAGSWTDVGGGHWLDSGTNADFWVRATLVAGTMDWLNSGYGTWLQLNVSRNWGLVDTSPGVAAETGTVRLEIATDSGGANIIAGPVDYTLSAWNDNGL